MKPIPIFSMIAGAVLLPLMTVVPCRAETDPNAKALAAVLLEVQAQQKTISENQAKIDEKLAVIAEQVRLARIYAARAGRGGLK